MQKARVLLLLLFRIITSVRTRYKKISFVIISTAIAYVIISASLISFGFIRIHTLNKREKPQTNLSINTSGSELISLSVTDTEVFDDTIRTIDVSLEKDCVLCDILITTALVNPILYSDNDYTNPSAHQARFSIPNNPPKEMSFRYGAAKVPSRITVSAVYKDENSDSFQFISRSIETGEK